MPDLFGQDDVPAVTPATRCAQVALEQGIDASPTGLTYAVPEALADLAVGERVIVPLGRGNRRVTGYVVELSDGPDDQGHRLKWIQGREKGGLSLPQQLVALARWISSYYCCPLGMVFGSMLPAAVKRGTGTVQRSLVRLAGGELPDRLTKLQRSIVEHADAETWVELRELADIAGAKTTGPVKGLIDKGVLELRHEEAVVSDLDLRASSERLDGQALTLNAGQQTAVDHLVHHLDAGFEVHLIHGVTGSGKTEVYLRVIEQVLTRGAEGGGEDEGLEPCASSADGGCGVIVLVPEIALTPQTVARFLQRFDRVAVLHSGLTAAQRHSQWRRIRSGEARIVIGARSAIFAPLPRLGLIIVDEEHEATYKQDQLPRYHARDVAIKRAQLADVPIVLGSATPSLESYANAMANARGGDEGKRESNGGSRRFHLLKLPDRAPGMKLPDVEIVDMVAERQARRGVHLMSQRLEQELHRVLAAPALSGAAASGGRAILLLNRRGYANYIACPDHRCGWMLTCDACDATCVYHKSGHLPAGGVVRCHHCLAEQLLPATCPTCGKKITVFGLGTQRVEEEFARKFPSVKVLRMDSDSMRTARDYRESLDRFRCGDVDVLLGTQMIAKGLDFPSVQLVGVISGDTSLHMPDFRAGERTFQLIAQVSGRAGRSETRGKVIVQSFSPQDPIIALAAQHDYEGFAQRELDLRRQVALPPIGRMARIVVRDRDHPACVERARTLADHLASFNEQLGNRVRLRGPMPCPIARIADHHRIQIELMADTAGPLQKLLTALRNTRLLISDAQTAVDVDPVSLL